MFSEAVKKLDKLQINQALLSYSKCFKHYGSFALSSKEIPVIYLQWIKLGANLSNFQFSLGSIVFHLGLGGKFKLCSWHDEQ